MTPSEGGISTWAPLLLADPSPTLRLLVLRGLLGRSIDDPEVVELADLRDSDPLVVDLLSRQSADGSWLRAGRDGAIQATAQALLLLGYLGFGLDHDGVKHGASYLFSNQENDGSWPLDSDDDSSERYSNYSMIPLQTSMPLRALAACGLAEDPRSEKAYEWLLSVRLGDGAWPSGLASGNYAGVAGYRRIPHSRWGCRSNTTAALICLAMHPIRRKGVEAKRALDLLLGRESLDRQAFGFEVARVLGAERAKGLFTYFARFDVALLLDLCWRVGASLEDDRVSNLVEFAKKEQGPYGLWEYRSRPQASRWVTFDVLRSLSNLDRVTDWVSLEPRTPFQPYPARDRRY
ncbi:MAG: hypothetical protein WA996_08330 [Candidatus Promineifilaceae bacterium]